jgi:hypothetical protein
MNQIFLIAWNHADDNERNFWRQAITKELKNMKKQGVWEIIDKKCIPKGRSLIESNWVFKQKKSGIYYLHFWDLIKNNFAESFLDGQLQATA